MKTRESALEIIESVLHPEMGEFAKISIARTKRMKGKVAPSLPEKEDR